MALRPGKKAANPIEYDLCSERNVYKLLGMDVWVVSHRHKVLSVTREPYKQKVPETSSPSAAAVADATVVLAEDGTNKAILNVLTVKLSTSKQRLDEIRIGVVDFGRHYVAPRAVGGLTDTIIRRHVAILTGYFGNNKRAVEEIAERVGAIFDRPLIQPFLLSLIHI